MAEEKLTKESVFHFLADSCIFGNLGLFIGAGLPMAVMNSEDEYIALRWEDLLSRCAKILEVDLKLIKMEGASYPDIASKLCMIYADNNEITHSEAATKLKQTIASITCWYPTPSKREEYKKYFESLNPKWIITTNYDLIIESILTGRGYSLGPDDQLLAPVGLVPVYHLHGVRTNPDSIVITQEDYVSLFRPNVYRQQKLPLTIKESVTVLIGYNLGDFNVLTSVDWSRNVYSEQKVDYPHGIIQFLYKEDPKKHPYKASNNITIVEFDDLSELLAEITLIVESRRRANEDLFNKIEKLNQKLYAPNNSMVEKFIDNKEFRKNTLEILEENNNYILSSFLEFFSRCIDETWERARPTNAFYAYDQNLNILLDIFETLNINTMPPALIEAATYQLDRVGSYVGTSLGTSSQAYKTWMKRKGNIPSETVKELKSIADARQYYSLKKLFRY